MAKKKSRSTPRMAHLHEIKNTIKQARKTAMSLLTETKRPVQEMREAITKDITDLVTVRDPIGKNRAETAVANMHHIYDKPEEMENGADRKPVLDPLEVFIPEKKEDTTRTLRASMREYNKEKNEEKHAEQKAIKLKERMVVRALKEETRKQALEKKKDKDKPAPTKSQFTTTGYKGTARPKSKVTVPKASLPPLVGLSFRPKPKTT